MLAPVPAAAQTKCTARKINEVAKKIRAKTGCHAKAVSRGSGVDGVCLSRAESRFASGFVRAESRPPCATTGDAAALEAKIDSFIADLSSELGGPGPSACTTAKYRAAGRKAFSKLLCHRKAVMRSAFVDPNCLSKAEARFTSDFTKAEARGGCLSTGDTLAIEAKVDALIADELAELAVECSAPPAPFASAKVVSSGADLVGGELARGVMGDFLLENDKIRVIVQKPGRVMFGIGIYGGNIIDADLRRSCGDERDNFEEIAALINVENTANYTNVTVLNDGTNNMPAVVRATGPDDLLDFINPSTVVNNFGVPGVSFPADQDDRDLPVDVQTDYILEQGKPYVRIETSLTNTSLVPVQIFFGDILNGSGAVELFQPVYGFGEPLITDPPCAPSSFQPCTAGLCDLCNIVAYSGDGDGAGVSYGYIHTENSSTSFSTSGVTVPILGRQILLVLIGLQQENFTLAPAVPLTITRYFAVGDGTVASLADIRNTIQGVSNTGTLTGTVTAGGAPLPNADVAVLGTPNPGGPMKNVVNHFRTGLDGSYTGTLPAGSYTVQANKDGRLFGTPNPAPVTITAGATTTQNFLMPDPGRMRVTITDENDDPIAAKIQLVGFDPSPDPKNTQTVLGLINNDMGVFGAETSDADGLPYGISFVTFASKDGDTGVVDVEPGSYALAVSHGPRYSASLQNVTITAGSTTTVAVQLARVVPTPGFVSGDFHVHAIHSPDSEVTNADRVVTELAEGMDFFTPSDHDIRVDFEPTLAALGVDDMISVAPSAEITTFDYGHFNSWPVTIDPGQIHGGGVDWGRAGIAAGQDFPSLGSYNLSPVDIYADAHADPHGNLIQINHMRSHFNFEGLDIDTAEGGTGPPQSHTPPLQRRLDPGVLNHFNDDFDALEVWIGTDGRTGDLVHFVGENLGDWFNMLNFGILRTGVASSDTHQKRTTQINARTYMPAAVTDPGLLGPEAENLAATIVAGKAIGTNGPFVTITAEAASTMETAGLGLTDNTLLSTIDGAVDVTVTIKSPIWAEFDKVQLFVNAAPQPFDHDAAAGTRNRYRALVGGNMCLTTSGCYEQSPTVTTVTDDPMIPGAQHLEATATFNLMALAEDTWIVALVRGTDGISKPLFPFIPNSINQGSNTTVAQLTDGNLNEGGVLALAFTNPLYVDVDGLPWTAPGVTLTPP
jgi:hypothetical protein